MKLLYIAGPYTRGDVALNVRRACEAAEFLWARGIFAIVPHLSHFHHAMFPREREDWMELDLEILSRCDGVVRLGGESEGADLEVAHAMEHGKPVYHSVREAIHANQ